MAVAYGAEELPPENVAPDSQQEKSPQDEGQEASDVDDNFKDVDDDTADVDVDNSIDAPETPTKRASGIGSSGDSDGLGWAVTAALMNFRPGHSIGFNYGRMGAGWLLSPQYRQNEELSEIRYVWRYRENKTFEIRVRQRDELDQLLTAQNKRNDLDLFVRMTSRFTLLER